MKVYYDLFDHESCVWYKDKVYQCAKLEDFIHFLVGLTTPNDFITLSVYNVRYEGILDLPY